MRKRVFGRKFQRDANERKALIKGLLNDLVLKDTIKTTEEKAKAIKGQAEKLVTKAKLRGEEARMFLQPYLSPKAVDKVISKLAPLFANRPGGYTRIVKLGQRLGDNARMALIEWVDKAEEVAVTKKAEKPVAAKATKSEAGEAAARVAKPKAARSAKTTKKETKTK